MGVAWSSYKEKRKEKKEQKRFVHSFIVYFVKKRRKLEHASHAVGKKNSAEKKYKS